MTLAYPKGVYFFKEMRHAKLVQLSIVVVVLNGTLGCESKKVNPLLIGTWINTAPAGKDTDLQIISILELNQNQTWRLIEIAKKENSNGSSIIQTVGDLWHFDNKGKLNLTDRSTPHTYFSYKVSNIASTSYSLQTESGKATFQEYDGEYDVLLDDL